MVFWFVGASLPGIPASVEPASIAGAYGWGLERPIEDGLEGSGGAQVAADSKGNAIAVWSHYDWRPVNFWDIPPASVWANRFVVGEGWGVAEPIERMAGTSYFPQVAVDPQGNAVAVWTQVPPNANDSVAANVYRAGIGWGVAEILSENASVPDVAIDAPGNALAVWVGLDGSPPAPRIFGNRFVPGQGWGIAQPLESGPGDPEWPLVAANAAGNAIAVWNDVTWGGPAEVFATRYAPGTGWGSPERVPGADRAAGISMDPNGVATVGSCCIQANRFTPGIGWGPPEVVGGGGGFHLAAGGDGSVVVVWQRDIVVRLAIFANRYTPGLGWGVEARVDDDLLQNARHPSVGLDRDGNAVAVWQQASHILANRYVVGTGWTGAHLVETYNGGFSRDPDVAVDPQGNAVAVWAVEGEAAGILRIWANRFVAPDLTPPSLTITEPSNGTVTQQSTIGVSGVTEPGAAISVSGVAAYVAGNGQFAVGIPLRPGTNVIEVTATDAAGNKANASVTVMFEDPTVNLRNELNETREALAAMSATLQALYLVTLVGFGAVTSALILFEVLRLRKRPNS